MCPSRRGACCLRRLPRGICPQEQSTECPALITRGCSGPSARVQMRAILSQKQGVFIIQASSTAPTVLCPLPCSGSIVAQSPHIMCSSQTPLPTTAPLEPFQNVVSDDELKCQGTESKDSNHGSVCSSCQIHSRHPLKRIFLGMEMQSLP